jgi:hypothetical protein
MFKVYRIRGAFVGGSSIDCGLSVAVEAEVGGDGAKGLDAESDVILERDAEFFGALV